VPGAGSLAATLGAPLAELRVAFRPFLPTRARIFSGIAEVIASEGDDANALVRAARAAAGAVSAAVLPEPPAPLAALPSSHPLAAVLRDLTLTESLILIAALHLNRRHNATNIAGAGVSGGVGGGGGGGDVRGGARRGRGGAGGAGGNAHGTSVAVQGAAGCALTFARA
jgi:hypothetical protein